MKSDRPFASQLFRRLTALSANVFVFTSANRQQGLDPGMKFVDHFNADVMPGVEIRGGFAHIDPGGRLPDHIHDSDESTGIIRGTANGVVDRRKHSMGDCAAAMIHRGCVHSFMNGSRGPMDMVWAYAGPMPERIVIRPGFVRE